MNSITEVNNMAGRYVLNQTPETLEKYFGTPINVNTEIREQSGENPAGKAYSTYTYPIDDLRELIPSLPRGATFQIKFLEGYAKEIALNPNIDVEPFYYNQAEATAFFKYVFGYEPPVWKEMPVPLVGHEGYSDHKYCLGDGVATSFISFTGGEDMIILSYDPTCEPPYT
jgi:hypothetical protein